MTDERDRETAVLQEREREQQFLAKLGGRKRETLLSNTLQIRVVKQCVYVCVCVKK